MPFCLQSSRLGTTTFNIKGLYLTHGINDTHHNKALHYPQCHNAEWRIIIIVMLNVVMLSVVAPVYSLFGGQYVNNIILFN